MTASPNDRAAVRVHDIGLHLQRNAAGELGFEVIVGGGLGRTPFVGKTVRDFLPAADLLSYLEAILRVYNLGGRRDNIHRPASRSRSMRSGSTGSANWWKRNGSKSGRVRCCRCPGRKSGASMPTSPHRPTRSCATPARTAWRPARQHPDFRRWLDTNLVAHKVPGYAIVNIPLKTPGRVPGDATATQMEAVADLADRYSFGEIRVTHRQNLVLVDVRQGDLFALWQELTALSLATPNVGLITDIISCPGLDYCALANARSINIAQSIGQRFASPERSAGIGDLTVNISGCMNACGHHHVGHIGILGVEKNGEEFYQLTLGGSSDQNASLGDRLGPGVSAAAVPGVIERIVERYQDIRRHGERFLDTYRRVGMDEFKQAAYATDNKDRLAAAEEID